MKKKKTELTTQEYTGLGVTGAGIAAAPKGYRRARGLKRVYHGTSDEKASGIKKSGLSPRFGNTGTTKSFTGGAGGVIEENAKKHIFVSTGSKGKLYSASQANLLEPGLQANMKAHSIEQNGAFFRQDYVPTPEELRKGRAQARLLKADIPYERYMEGFAADPDWVQGNKAPADRIAKMKEQASKQSPKRQARVSKHDIKFRKSMQVDAKLAPGFRSKKRIQPRYFDPMKKKISLRANLSYIKGNKARFAKGLIPGAAILGGGSLLHNAIQKRRKKNSDSVAATPRANAVT